MFLCFKSVPVCKFLAIKLVCCVEEFSFIAVAKIVIMSTAINVTKLFHGEKERA